ncbi:MAG: hypothetical protein LBU09_01850 [Endomicrobium sp.]|jgi:hypothetical protein|nr:hypothetical protein [Endomicrobium sp.]
MRQTNLKAVCSLQAITHNDWLTKIIDFDESYITPNYNNLTTSLYEDTAEKIEFYKKKCSLQNWGGDNERAFDLTTIENINRFKEIILKRCLEYPPFIYVTDDAQLAFEWESEKYQSFIRINKFGLIFMKTFKEKIVLHDGGGDEVCQSLYFLDKSDEDLKRSLYPIFIQINNTDSL